MLVFILLITINIALSIRLALNFLITVSKIVIMTRKFPWGKNFQYNKL